MNRRDFIKNCVIGLGALGLGLNVKGKPVVETKNIPEDMLPQGGVSGGFLNPYAEENLGGYLVPQRYINQIRMALDAEKAIKGKPVKITLEEHEYGDLSAQWTNALEKDVDFITGRGVGKPLGVLPISERMGQARTEFSNFISGVK